MSQMKNRIDEKFRVLRANGKKAFIAFLTAGDPDLKATVDLVLAFEKAGVDIVELGVPFSDPLADGPTIQASYERALAKGVTLDKILHAVAEIRKHSQIPLALMSSYNPVFHYGEERLIKTAKVSGVDGFIIPDLPPEEAKHFIACSRREKMSTVFFLSPTTTDQRIKKNAAASTGFIYYVSLTGVTGTRQDLPRDLMTQIKKAKAITTKPICVGFGISSAAQVKAVSRFADGVIVGSAIVKEIEKHTKHADCIAHVTRFVKHLCS